MRISIRSSFLLLASGPGLSLSAPAALIGHWALDEGAGNVATDSSPSGNDAAINGATWASDAERGTFLTFTGDPGSFLDMGDTTVPVMTLANDFTWAFWARRAVGDAEPNSVVFGNRYNPSGLDFAPREFIKFTPTQFEWHSNGNGSDNLDYADLPNGVWHHHAVVKSGATITYYRDGVVTASRTVTQALLNPQPLYGGGETVTDGGEFFNGSLADLRIYDHALTAQEVQDLITPPDLPPVFSSNPVVAGPGSPGQPYAGTLQGAATDPGGGTVTYAKLDGPDWMQVAPDGSLSGTPGPADEGTNQFTVEASNGSASISATLLVPILPTGVTLPNDALFGWWPLNDGGGDLAVDLSGNGRDANIMNVSTGGLGVGGAAWVEDPECGTVLSFNGVDGTGTYAVVGSPPATGTLPVFTLDPSSQFTWSFWAKTDQVADTSIILGNRYDQNGVEFVPREFIKFTPLSFEWDTNNVQGINYADIAEPVWMHHAIVKQGATLTYYRQGVALSTGTVVSAPVNPQPLFFGGQGIENWRGSLFDIRLFETALTSAQVLVVFSEKGEFTPQAGPRLEVASSGDNLVFTWDSAGGKLYTLRSETDPSSAEPIAWPVFGGQIDLAATPPQNSLTIPRPADPRRFFVVEEYNAPPISIFSDDFESGQGLWTTGSDGDPGTEWELGTPSVVGPFAANSGTNCFGTDLDADYQNDTDIWLRSPPIDLTTAGGATLNFAHFRDFEPAFDFGTVTVLDAANDSPIAVVLDNISDASIDWESVARPIPAAALGATIRLEFRFSSDFINTFAGWYIDDVEVTVP